MSTVLELSETRQRFLAYIINEFILWHLIRLRPKFDGDIDNALILGEIAHYNVKKSFHKFFCKNDLSALYSAEEIAKFEQLQPFFNGSNNLSISAATGIPRETVRRKVKALEQAGWIAKDEKGNLFMTQQPAQEFAGFNQETVDGFLSTVAKIQQLINEGFHLPENKPENAD